MSKRHQVSRRRSYGRRQHEIHERFARLVAVMDWHDDTAELAPIRIWDRLEPVSAGYGPAPERRTV